MGHPCFQGNNMQQARQIIVTLSPWTHSAHALGMGDNLELSRKKSFSSLTLWLRMDT